MATRMPLTPRSPLTQTLMLAMVFSALSSHSLAADKPVTAEEVQGYVEAMDEAIATKDVKAHSRLLDIDAFFDRVTKGITASPRLKSEFLRGARIGMEQSGLFLKPLIDMVEKGGAVEFLRSRSREQLSTALFRIRTAEHGIGYSEFYLRRSPDGSVRAVDFYGYFSGELVSETLRRSFLSVAAFEDRGMLSRLIGSDRDFIDSLDKVKAMQEHLKAGKFAEAEGARNALPESVRKRKENLLLWIMVTQQLDEAKYLKAIEELQATLPNDPCVHLHLIDKYTLTKEYDKALAEVDRLGRSVGGDPFLDLQRTSLNILAGRLDKARSLALKLAESVPDDFTARTVILDVDLKRKDYASVLRVLKQVDQDFRLRIGELPNDETYGEFLKTPEYQKWLAYVKERDAEPAANS